MTVGPARGRTRGFRTEAGAERRREASSVPVSVHRSRSAISRPSGAADAVPVFPETGNRT
ncbi:hypothetical protein CP557_14125 [Natrinema ejinorense]|uniref:Uncharacterized protein n=1 Tax=Natrinema ejinorense TaxID=373386 RepID=A0A2A5QXJ3_9EURY|nr:hypothetical protein CP557_14125 [Natrinema ejinorense]